MGETREQGKQGKRLKVKGKREKARFITFAFTPCPMPHAPCPMPHPFYR
ncbi:histidine kinase [Nostoc linckia]|nr:histidine kinase [Nostoc linckia]